MNYSIEIHNIMVTMIVGGQPRYHLRHYHQFKLDIILVVTVMVTAQIQVVTEVRDDIITEKLRLLQIHDHIIIMQALIIILTLLILLDQGNHLSSITPITTQIFNRYFLFVSKT